MRKELGISTSMAVELAIICLRELCKEGVKYAGQLVGMDILNHPLRVDKNTIIVLRCKTWPTGNCCKEEVLVVVEFVTTIGHERKAHILVGRGFGNHPTESFTAELPPFPNPPIVTRNR